MKNGTALAHDSSAQIYATDINATLESARSQLEQRFLDGGAVLLSVMEVIKRLLTSLDQLTRALDSDGQGDADAELRSTVQDLTELPAQASERQRNLAALAEAGSRLRVHVSDMQETMRYLRTFAVTVKITGAGIAEFAGFAEEILERIHSGTGEVNSFAAELAELEKDVRIAMAFGADVAQGYAETVPQVTHALQDDARKIAQHRQELAQIASKVGTIARGVQAKVATTLSALQIGDITRQRIEHVQSTLIFLDEFFASSEGRQLDAGSHRRIENVFHHLAAAQMNDICRDFERESRNVVRTISSFGHDTQEILKLRDSMQDPDGGSDNPMRALEESISVAHGIVRQVEQASRQADKVSQSTLGTAAKLLRSIENIRAVKTDIHYMALNTNLRCSRMGEEGRSINVVTAELRIFAAKLDESADEIVNGLGALEKAAAGIAPGQEAGTGSLDDRLSAAVGSIRSAADTMEQELAVLSEHGREVAGRIGLSISKLDFQHDLGEVLSRCADSLNDQAGGEMADVSDIAGAMAALDQKVFKLYTMMQERTIHRQVLPADDTVAPAPVETAKADDEDLFADALF